MLQECSVIAQTNLSLEYSRQDMLQELWVQFGLWLVHCFIWSWGLVAQTGMEISACTPAWANEIVNLLVAFFNSPGHMANADKI